MITYTNRTLREVYDEVIVRMGQHRTTENTDWETVVKFINNAINEVLVKTLPYKDWAFVRTIPIANLTVLPVEFIRPIRVMLQRNENSPFIEARHVAPREYFSLIDWHKQQLWNQAIHFVPLYTIWGGIDLVTAGLPPIPPVITTPQNTVIHIFPNTAYYTGAPPVGYTYHNYDLQGFMEYYGSHIFLTNDTDIIPLPYELEDLLVNCTLLRIFAKTANAMQVQFIQSLIVPEILRIQAMYQEKRRTERRELDNFIEPVVPTIPAPPDQGEFRSKM